METLSPDIASGIGEIAEKWKMVPAFMQARGLVKQHISSFDFFINSELRTIVEANREIR